MAETRSALAGFGIKPWPIGSREGIIKDGYDPKDVASCCEPEGAGGNRGCPVWEKCRFNHPSMGGFKGDGPHYIAYRNIDTDDGTASQQSVECFKWVLTLQGRADAGAAQRRVTNGKRGQVLRIIGQEGDEYVEQVNVGYNAKGEVVNVMPELVEDFKRNNIKFSTVVNDPAVTYRFLELKRIVPTFPRAGEERAQRADNFAQRVAMWDIDNEQRDRGFIESASVPEVAEEENLVLQASPEAIAEPEKKVNNPYGRKGKPKDAA